MSWLLYLLIFFYFDYYSPHHQSTHWPKIYIAYDFLSKKYLIYLLEIQYFICNDTILTMVLLAPIRPLAGQLEILVFVIMMMSNLDHHHCAHIFEHVLYKPEMGEGD